MARPLPRCDIEGCEGQQEFAALAPIVVGDEVIPPHRLNLCYKHYTAQWESVYGGKDGNPKKYSDYAKGDDAGGRQRGVRK